MAGKRKNRQVPKWYATAVAILVLISGVISWNETLEEPIFPTWDQVFDTAALSDDPESVPLPAGTLQIDMLDVGNADAILLQSDGKTMLIDAGESGDGDTVLDTLEEKNIAALDYVVATHADSDHIGGMAKVLNGVTVKNYVMAFMPEGHTPTTKTYERVLTALDEREVPLIEAEPGYRFSLGEAQVELLGPVEDFEDNNNQSVVLKVTFGNSKFLFTGDAEEPAEQALLDAGTDLSADVLKVGHHGSSTGSIDAFLDAVSPSYALIPCGVDNAYDHPHDETIARLQKRGVKIYRSDLNGRITLLCDGETITVTTERGEAS